MSAPTAAAGASTEATTNQPTGASPDRDIKEKDPPNNNTEPKAPPYSEADDNAGTAPLLPTYSFRVATPAPRATWRSMTGGLVAERNTVQDEKQDSERSKHPGVCKVYGSKTTYLFIQWFATTVVLGTTAQSLHLSDKLPSIVPMLAYLLICAVVHIIAMYYFIREKSPVSSKDPRPARWYLISYTVSCFAWVAAMVCVVLVEVASHQFRFDRNKDDGMCGYYLPLPSLDRTMVGEPVIYTTLRGWELGEITGKSVVRSDYDSRTKHVELDCVVCCQDHIAPAINSLSYDEHNNFDLSRLIPQLECTILG
ncbi:hypothetical protein V494_00329 [Pseudogymnoascus sp. VKM F-4513 (FW-928)]|nr:hypothetical protein V494_00329 [Pseudogymnoascus sp. VKM F-4513 (FW-928)]